MRPEEIPDKYRGRYKKAISGKLSPRETIRLNCCHCMGWSYSEAKRCTCTSCPLWRYSIAANVRESKQETAGLQNTGEGVL
jgi:hypothetical protein